jgi:carboxyl-terminal processing protease
MRVTLIVFLIHFSNTLCGQFHFIADINISPENYAPNLNEINTIVSKKYSHLKNKKINLDSLYMAVHSKASHAQSKDEYFKCLLTYFSKLNNSHTTIYLREYGLKASVKMIERRLFLEKIDDDIFLGAGIAINDEVMQIDGIPTINWLNIQRKYVSASTPKHQLNKTLWKVFNSEFKVSRTYKIKTDEGVKTVLAKLETPTNYAYTYPQDVPKCSGIKLNEVTGYISINSMTGSVVNEFESVYDSLFKLPNLIIDLRENTGGNSGYSEQISSYLISTQQKACVSRKKIKPKANSYKGNVYVLIGVKTSSAAESLVIDLVESRSAILIGGSTAGDTGNGPSNFITDYGISFRIPTRKPQVSFNNFPMEGTGIPPHFFVNQKVEDFNDEQDTILEYTLNHIYQHQ